MLFAFDRVDDDREREACDKVREDVAGHLERAEPSNQVELQAREEDLVGQTNDKAANEANTSEVGAGQPRTPHENPVEDGTDAIEPNFGFLENEDGETSEASNMSSESTDVTPENDATFERNIRQRRAAVDVMLQRHEDQLQLESESLGRQQNETGARKVRLGDERTVQGFARTRWERMGVGREEEDKAVSEDHVLRRAKEVNVDNWISEGLEVDASCNLSNGALASALSKADGIVAQAKDKWNLDKDGADQLVADAWNAGDIEAAMNRYKATVDETTSMQGNIKSASDVLQDKANNVERTATTAQSALDEQVANTELMILLPDSDDAAAGRSDTKTHNADAWIVAQTDKVVALRAALEGHVGQRSDQAELSRQTEESLRAVLADTIGVTDDAQHRAEALEVSLGEALALEERRIDMERAVAQHIKDAVDANETFTQAFVGESPGAEAFLVNSERCEGEWKQLWTEHSGSLENIIVEPGQAVNVEAIHATREVTRTHHAVLEDAARVADVQMVKVGEKETALTTAQGLVDLALKGLASAKDRARSGEEGAYDNAGTRAEIAGKLEELGSLLGECKANAVAIVARMEQHGNTLKQLVGDLRKAAESAQRKLAEADSAHAEASADWKAMLEKVKQSENALQNASVELKANHTFMLEAVGLNGLTLHYAADALRADPALVLEAVKQNGSALEYAADELKANRPFMLKVVVQDSSAFLTYIAEELTDDREFMLEAGYGEDNSVSDNEAEAGHGSSGEEAGADTKENGGSSGSEAEETDEGHGSEGETGQERRNSSGPSVDALGCGGKANERGEMWSSVG